MKTTRPNRQRRRGRGGSPRLPEGAKASCSLPDTGVSPPWRPLGVAFLRQRGEGRALRTLRHPSSPAAVTGGRRRPPTHSRNLRPRRLQPARASRIPRQRGAAPLRAGRLPAGPLGAAARPLPGNSNAPRERWGPPAAGGDAEPAAARPRGAPPVHTHAHAPSTQPQPLGAQPAANRAARQPPQPAAPPPSHRPPRHTHAASRHVVRGGRPRGRCRPVGGAQPEAADSFPRPTHPRRPRPGTGPALALLGHYSREITAQESGKASSLFRRNF